MSRAFGVELPFVVVEWDDAWKDDTHDVDAIDAEREHKVARTYSAGWLLVDNEKGVQLSATCSPDEGLPYGQRRLIPRAMIVAIHSQKLSQPRKPRRAASAPSTHPPSDDKTHRSILEAPHETLTG